jgi:uncharacterized OB-fold protein
MGDEPFTNAAYCRFLEEHKLMGCRCEACGAVYLPPRPICTECHGEDMVWAELGGQGTLRSFTAIHVAPTPMVEAGHGRDNPYLVGVVQVDGGPSVSAQIVGVDATRPEAIEVGRPVEVAFIERGEGDDRRTYLAFRCKREKGENP